MKLHLGWVVISEDDKIRESGSWVGGTRRKLYKFKKTAENNCPRGHSVKEAIAEI